MDQLKERGVYRLPDGREVVALRGLQSGHFLYSSDALDHYKLPEYEVNEAGQLISGGEATGWSIHDLADTGRSFSETERVGSAASTAEARP